MPDKRVPLVSGEYYHVFNRRDASQPVFLNKNGYSQAVQDLSYYRFVEPPVKLSAFKKLNLLQQQEILGVLLKENFIHVRILSFVLMPNHFHFLLQQINENGISTFLSKFTNSYTRHFNIKQDRVGPLFQ